MTSYNVINRASMQADQPEDVSVVLANLDAIAAIINGDLDNANLKASAAIVLSKLGQSGASTGQYAQWNGSSWAPASVTFPSSLPWGTALPGSPADEEPFVLTDSVTAPTWAWHLRYDAGIADAHKWVFVGGSMLSLRTDATSTNTSNTSPTYDGVTQVVVPKAGIYRVGGHAFNVTNSGAAFCGFRCGSSGSVFVSPNTGGGYVEMRFTLAASDTVQWTHWVSGGHSGTWNYREVFAIPERISP